MVAKKLVEVNPGREFYDRLHGVAGEWAWFSFQVKNGAVCFEWFVDEILKGYAMLDFQPENGVLVALVYVGVGENPTGAFEFSDFLADHAKGNPKYKKLRCHRFRDDDKLTKEWQRVETIYERRLK